MKKRKKAIGYFYLSDGQRSSIDELTGRIEKFSLQHHIQLIGINQDVKSDEKEAIFKREGLVNLMEQVEKEKIPLVIIPEEKYLSPQLEERSWILFELERRKIHVRFLSMEPEENKKDPIVQWVNKVVLFIAKTERERVVQNLVDGRKDKKKLGGFIGGRPPLGYIIVKGSGELHIDPQKVETVRRIFELHEKNFTNKAVADHLNKEGYTTQNGALFTPVQIQRALARRDLYEGKKGAPVIIINENETN